MPTLRLPINKVLIHLSLPTSLALAFLYWTNCEEKSGNAPIIGAKVLSTFLLAYYGAFKNPTNKSLNNAFKAHCVGDLLVELPIEDALLIAVPAFFLGHLCYSAHLAKNSIFLRDISFPTTVGLCIFSLSSYIITNYITDKASGMLSYAIPAYALALSSMFALAVLQKQNTTSTTLLAFSYVSADVIIAMCKLVFKIESPTVITWPLYYGSQFATLWRNAKPETQPPLAKVANQSLPHK